MLVRRKLVHDGLLLMQGRSLVDRLANSEGILYRAGDEARNPVSYLTTRIFDHLDKRRHIWLLCERSWADSDFNQLVEERLERWAIQFQSAAGAV